jgi:glucose-6-phosphate isomerase
MQTNPKTSLIEPFGVQFDLAEGIMRDPEEHNVRHASAMRGYYADEGALERLIASEGDPIHYETFESRVPEENGHVKFCISKLYPGVVGEECFMTKGHYHTVQETGEIYLCLKGEGLMMMKLSDGACRWEEFVPGRLVYAPPYWAHRSINTGDEPLISLCVYPGDAGHNYGDIETGGFPRRVFRRNERIVVE